VEHLVLQQKAQRTVQAYTAWIYDLTKFHRRSPDQLGQPEIRAWILHLITERKLSAASIHLAINALRACYHALLGHDVQWRFHPAGGLATPGPTKPQGLFTLLFDAASATLLQFGAERFGVRIGLTALLHTWGQNLRDHPHLHCLVTSGGLTQKDPP